MLGVGVVGRGDLDDVGADQVDAVQAADDGPQLARRPASRLGGARGGRKGRVERVDVDAEVRGVVGAHAVADLLDDALDPDGVDLARLDDLETTICLVSLVRFLFLPIYLFPQPLMGLWIMMHLPVPIIFVVRRAAQGGPDTSMDVGVVLEQALHGGVVEVGAVVDASDLGGGTAKDLGLPGVQVAVEVDDGHGAVLAVDRPQQG